MKIWVNAVSPVGVLSATQTAQFQGPGDIISGATMFFSPARAYNAAFAATGGPIMDLLDQAGANPITINILTTGFADLVSIANWVAANSVTTIKVTKLYDQTGNNNNVSRSILANMPNLTLNALGGLPGVTGDGSNDSLENVVGLFSGGPTFSVACVSIRTTGTTALGRVFGWNIGSESFGYRPTVNTFGLNDGAVLTATASDNAFHAIIGAANGLGTSSVVVDGVASTGSAGNNNWTNVTFAILADVGGGSAMGGSICEVGYWPTIVLSPTQYGNLNANMHGTSGYNF